jgi:predicted DNA-binding transcriptional regulator AlpA
MRNYLTTKDLARLSGYTHAQICNWAKAGKIPGKRVLGPRKRCRFVDSDVLRMWAEVKSKRLSADELIVECFKAIVSGVIQRERERGGDPPEPSDIVGEVFRQLNDSNNPVQLFEKWARAVWEQRFEDLPQVP